MTSMRRYGQGGLLILAAGLGLAAMTPAGAQIWPPAAKSDGPAAQVDADTPDADGADVANKDADIKDLQLDWTQLNVDASTLTWTPASKARANPKAAAGAADASWSSSDKSNGSSDVSVKQSLSSFLDTRVGADMTVTRPPQTLTESQLLSEKLANGGNLPQSSGTAWAAITAPGAGSIWDKTAIEARVDPSQDQTRLGTSLSKSLPLNEQYSLSLQNGYNLIEQGVVPVPGIIGRPVRNYETEQSAKLSIADTGTSFTAASRSPPPTTDGSARSAPSRNCSAASAFRARSAKPRSAPRTRVSAPGSGKAGRYAFLGPIA
jgi:hypothetical protein